ncbi:hypothetical protein V5740_10685 [Croceibacterium sp. TMG7-5b_MA50]|uniref:hypothetical protein n=1 Tax=Croceibacterium sp. TMG7-5b_MA50 TaxID=3121290 RepID=UPI0032216CE1
MMQRVTAAGAAAMLAAILAGCTTDRFVPLAGQFGALTRDAAEEQNERLAVVIAEERERSREALTERAADLRAADCTQAIAGIRVAMAAALPQSTATCRVIEREANGTLVELPSELRFDNIAALNDALAGYAEGLILLAANSAEDEAVLTQSVSELTIAIGELDGAIRAATGDESATSTDRIDAAGGLLARLGTTYMTARRQAVLKRLILEADPLVARATSLLGGTDGALDLYDSVARYAAIEQAVEAAGAARSAGDPAALGEQQAALFDAVETYNAYPAEERRYAAIGAAHAGLAAAARAGADAADLSAAAQAVIGLAQAIGATRKAFAGETP